MQSGQTSPYGGNAAGAQFPQMAIQSQSPTSANYIPPENMQAIIMSLLGGGMI